MASRDVMKASVFQCGVIEQYVYGDVVGGNRSRPIRVILVLGDDSSMVGRFVEHLIVSETHLARPQQLADRHRHLR